jgi:hypothetical protein
MRTVRGVVDLGCIVSCGSWIAPPALLDDGDSGDDEEVTDLECHVC